MQQLPSEIGPVTPHEAKLLSSMGFKVPKHLIEQTQVNEEPNINPKPYTLGVASTCRLCNSVTNYAIRFALVQNGRQRPFLEKDPWSYVQYHDADVFTTKQTNTCKHCHGVLSSASQKQLLNAITKLAVFAPLHIVDEIGRRVR